VNNYDGKNLATHTAGVFRKRTFDLARTSAMDFFKYWELEADTVEFIGHACALYPDDTFLQGTAAELVQRVQVRMLN